MAGVAYGVGVGPGDPELVTLKALRVLRACDVVAFPGTDAFASRAFRIAEASCPELGTKELLALPAPMVGDRAIVEAAQRDNARRVERVLDEGRDVAILVLGDPALYSTFGYVRDVLVGDGYSVETISGVPSFCAAAARLGVSLAEWDETVRIVPLMHTEGRGDALGLASDPTDTLVLMKPGEGIGAVRDYAISAGRDLLAVENCGLDAERVYRCAADVPDRLGYLSVALLRGANPRG